ncbi:glycosyltransferase family 4 protein [Clostridium homopropionicum]|uniref:glycosyltransferase family 4 protein n=1 Tax=Clostridium homopropionicum TaxID=36844 RepID=UPI001FA91EBC|nr:glycosyltransferase family 4 protein [Clostridium homopropionicum]
MVILRYCVLYPNTRNVNLVKEMGMIPYKLHKLFNYDSKIVCYNLDEYSYLKEEVSGLKIDFLPRKFNNYSIDGFLYLKKEAKNIDILQIFHVTMYSLVYAYTYKFFNPKGKIYLKLDCSHKLVEKILSLNMLEYYYLNKYLNKVDLISIEQEILYKKLKDILPKQKDKMIHIPNGVDFEYLERKKINYNFDSKENIILSVARVGTEEKNTEMLLEAFKNINNIENSGWKLVVAGPIEKGFNKYLENFLMKNPELRNLIEFKGDIKSREKLFKLYKKSKIFTLTSRFESFGIAFIEAAALGNVIVSTDVGIARELIGKENGAVVETENTKELTKKIESFIASTNLRESSFSTYNICYEKFNWDKIIDQLHSSLEKLFR